jgi:S1-C subfamily serine protease
LAKGISAEGGISELEALRRVERRIVTTIESAVPAIAFLQGGSGFMISADGYLLTNAHVVSDKITNNVVQRPKRKKFDVYLRGGQGFVADLVGSDPEGDVALLKLRGNPKVPFLEFGDSDTLEIGQQVIALGDPFLIGSEELFIRQAPPDYQPSASLGIISALHRNSDTYRDAIQVDVAVNRGNSGGPLLTLDGKVVGINGKIETRFQAGVNTGVGYSIHINQVKRFLGPLKRAKGGVVRHGTIDGLALATRAREGRGLRVTGVKADSPAHAAGFLKEDRILSIDGLPVSSLSRFDSILGTYPAGEHLLVKLSRGAMDIELKAALLEPGALPYLGIKCDTGPQVGARIINVDPNSPAGRAGLKDRDVIVSLAGMQVTTHQQLDDYLLRKLPGDLLAVEVVRTGGPLKLAVLLAGQTGPEQD